MSPDVSTYLTGLTLAWGLLLTYCLVALRTYRNWAVKRWLLLGGYVTGLIVPVLALVSFAADSGILRAGRYVFRPLAERVYTWGGPTAPGVAQIDWPLLLYLLGCALVVLLKARSWWQLRRYRREGEVSVHAGYSVVRHVRIGSPFVALGRMYLPTGPTDAVVLLHETEHLRAGHHLDGLLLDVSQIVLWFHPFHYLFRRLLSDVHEFHCDRRVTTIIPAREYGRQLLRHALTGGRPLGIATSPLKTRIRMLFTKTTSRFSPLRFVSLLLLLAGIGLGTLAMGPQPAGKFPEMVIYDGTVLQTEEDFVRTFYRHITYPLAARDAGLVGHYRFEFWADAVRMYSYRSRRLPMDEEAADVLQAVVVGRSPATKITDRGDCETFGLLNDHVIHTLEQLKIRSLGDQDAVYSFSVKFTLESP